jgi:hypothetical protein
MKKSWVKLGVVLVAVLLVIGATSCNRGYGCPNNFSVEVVLD